MGLEWKQKAGYNVVLGGPAYGSGAGNFISGLFLKSGITITSRGCNNNCWFCYVPKREGSIRPLPVTAGWNVMDSNILQCPEWHIKKVFDMLRVQSQRPVFTGGLESSLLKDWHVDLLYKGKAARIYFAYDTPDDYEPLVIAAKKMRNAGFKYSRLSCYVLIGYPKDTMEKAKNRLQSVVSLGIMPFAMLWKNEAGETNKEWRRFQRSWAAPVAVGCRMKKAGW